MEETNLKDDNNKTLLENLYQITRESICYTNTVFSKTCNDSFKNLLEKNKQFLCEIKVECEMLAKTLGVTLQEYKWLKKMRKVASLNFQIFLDDCTENLSKLLIINLNKSIIEIITALDNCPNAIEEIINVGTNLKKNLEKNLETYKKYLIKNPSSFNKTKNNSETKKKSPSKKQIKTKKKE